MQSTPGPTATWPSPPKDLSLTASEVHILAAPLDLPDDVRAKFADTLSPDEQERAARFKFDHHRHRFIAARGWLRSVLARYLRVDAAKLEFAYSSLGKPELSPQFNRGPIHFNLAHSADLALLAVTGAGPIGIDVERIRFVKDADELVARFFSPNESALFQKVAPDQRPAAFFNLWTRKEALLKATGEGIGKSLSEVEVSFLPGDPARLLAIGGDSKKAAQWNLRELTPAPGFVGALAIQAANIPLRCWQLP